jgi:hypothetical protein
MRDKLGVIFWLVAQQRLRVKLKDGSIVHSEWMAEDEASFERDRVLTAMNFGILNIGQGVVPVGNATTVRAADIDSVGLETQGQPSL